MPSRASSHLCSYPPANPGLTFSLLSVVVDIAMSMMGRTIFPTVGSNAEHSEKDDVVQPPRRKRRRVITEALATGGTALQRLTRPDRGDSSSREAQGSSQRPKRQGKRDATRQPSSRESNSYSWRICRARVSGHLLIATEAQRGVAVRQIAENHH
jgi:hypothetical protein